MCGWYQNTVGGLMEQLNNVKVLYEAKEYPIFQNRMYDSYEEAITCPKGDILLVENLETGLIYNDAFLQERVIYDVKYQNEQGVSYLFQQHLESVSDIIDHYIGRDLIIEVGCGKGSFLEMLLVKGFDVTGFDPTYEGHNPRIVKQNFQTGVGIKAEGLILRHVLEHIQNPFDFLLKIKEANGGSGKIYLEVPCFNWICNHRAWFDIFYEHVNYFRLADFYRMFGSLVKSGHFFGGQYLFVVAELATLRKPEIDLSERVAFPDDFMSVPSGSDRTAIWGGASKGTIFALCRERIGQAISTVIDINPAKQGKYLPSTGLRVQAPAEALAVLPHGSTIYVMNSNYLKEIKEMSDNVYNYIEVDHECF